MFSSSFRIFFCFLLLTIFSQNTHPPFLIPSTLAFPLNLHSPTNTLPWQPDLPEVPYTSTTQQPDNLPGPLDLSFLKDQSSTMDLSLKTSSVSSPPSSSSHSNRNHDDTNEIVYRYREEDYDDNGSPLSMPWQPPGDIQDRNNNLNQFLITPGLNFLDTLLRNKQPKKNNNVNSNSRQGNNNFHHSHVPNTIDLVNLSYLLLDAMDNLLAVQGHHTLVTDLQVHCSDKSKTGMYTTFGSAAESGKGGIQESSYITSRDIDTATVQPAAASSSSSSSSSGGNSKAATNSGYAGAGEGSDRRGGGPVMVYRRIYDRLQYNFRSLFAALRKFPSVFTGSSSDNDDDDEGGNNNNDNNNNAFVDEDTETPLVQFDSDELRELQSIGKFSGAYPVLPHPGLMPEMYRKTMIRENVTANEIAISLQKELKRQLVEQKLLRRRRREDSTSDQAKKEEEERELLQPPKDLSKELDKVRVANNVTGADNAFFEDDSSSSTDKDDERLEDKKARELLEMVTMANRYLESYRQRLASPEYSFSSTASPSASEYVRMENGLVVDELHSLYIQLAKAMSLNNKHRNMVKKMQSPDDDGKEIENETAAEQAETPDDVLLARYDSFQKKYRQVQHDETKLVLDVSLIFLNQIFALMHMFREINVHTLCDKENRKRFERVLYQRKPSGTRSHLVASDDEEQEELQIVLGAPVWVKSKDVERWKKIINNQSILSFNAITPNLATRQREEIKQKLKQGVEKGQEGIDNQKEETRKMNENDTEGKKIIEAAQEQEDIRERQSIREKSRRRRRRRRRSIQEILQSEARSKISSPQASPVPSQLPPWFSIKDLPNGSRFSNNDKNNNNTGTVIKTQTELEAEAAADAVRHRLAQILSASCDGLKKNIPGIDHIIDQVEKLGQCMMSYRDQMHL